MLGAGLALRTGSKLCGTVNLAILFGGGIDQIDR